MLRNSSLGIGSLALALAPTGASAASFGYDLRLTVPVQCSLHHQATPSITAAAPSGAVSLGAVQEYCNAPGGYQVVVTYTPGSLRGARLIAGEDEVRLNGSGSATLSRTNGPRKRMRVIAAIPGEGGFDTDRFDLRIIPTV